MCLEPAWWKGFGSAGSFPLQFAAGIVVGFGAGAFGKPFEINVGQEFGFDVVDRLLEGFDEFVKVFFVEKQFVFFVGKAIALWMPPTLGNGQKIIVGTGSPDVEKIRPLPCFDPV